MLSRRLGYLYSTFCCRHSRSMPIQVFIALLHVQCTGCTKPCAYQFPIHMILAEVFYSPNLHFPHVLVPFSRSLFLPTILSSSSLLSTTTFVYNHLFSSILHAAPQGNIIRYPTIYYRIVHYHTVKRLIFLHQILHYLTIYH